MGNQLTRDYQIEEKPIASGGTHFIWKIYEGMHKSTKQEVSIFMCTIKELEQRFGKSNVSKIVQRLRNDANILARLKHPHVIKLQQPLIESSKEIALVTERIIGSLPNLLLQDYTNVPGGIASIPIQYKNYGLHELELKYGLSQILDALAFCHSDAKLVHLNLIPHNIFITPNGSWKLGGFQFSYFKNYANAIASPLQQDNEIVLYSGKSTKGAFVPLLDYSAPEYVLQNKPDMSSDIFSLGCMLYQFMSNDKKSTFLKCHESIHEYQGSIRYLQNMTLTNMSSKTRDALKSLLSENPDSRPYAVDILKTDLMATLFSEEVYSFRCLNILKLQDPVKKAQFLRNFEVLLSKTNQFPDRILQQVVLPALLIELRDMKAAVFALPCVIYIAQNLSTKEFGSLILPTLSKVFMYTQPPKIPLNLLQNFEILLSKTTPGQHKNFIIPFLVRCLDSQFPDVQTESLKRAEECFNNNLLSYHDFKHQVLPRIQAIAQASPHAAVRVNAVVCLGKSCAQLDKDALMDTVFPVLEHCLKVDKTSNCVMTVVGVYLKISKLNVLKIEDLACRVLPNIIPIMVERTLNYDQFQKFLKAFRDISNLVEQQRLKEFNEAKELEYENNLAEFQRKPDFEEGTFAPPVESNQDQEAITPSYDTQSLKQLNQPAPLPRVVQDEFDRLTKNFKQESEDVEEEEDFFARKSKQDDSGGNQFDMLLSRFEDKKPNADISEHKFSSQSLTPRKNSEKTEINHQEAGFDKFLNKFIGEGEQSPQIMKNASDKQKANEKNDGFSSLNGDWYKSIAEKENSSNHPLSNAPANSHSLETFGSEQNQQKVQQPLPHARKSTSLQQDMSDPFEQLLSKMETTNTPKTVDQARISANFDKPSNNSKIALPPPRNDAITNQNKSNVSDSADDKDYLKIFFADAPVGKTNSTSSSIFDYDPPMTANSSYPDIPKTDDDLYPSEKGKTTSNSNNNPFDFDAHLQRFYNAD